VIWTNILEAVATFAAVVVALSVAIFGPRRVTKPKLSVTLTLEAPDCMGDFKTEGRTTGNLRNIDQYNVRLRVTNHGNEDARDVEVMMVKLWAVMNGTPKIDPLFLPLLLRWSWWPEGSSAWLQKLLPGMFKHCDFLVVTMGDHTMTDGETRINPEAHKGPKPWITFQTAYGLNDISARDSKVSTDGAIMKVKCFLRMAGYTSE
jgi:hypothetical protein